MRIINSKNEIRAVADELTKLQLPWASTHTIDFIHEHLLKKKVRFPILEYFTELIYPLVPLKEQEKFLRKIIDLDEIGSYVIAGKFLQLQLTPPKIPGVFKLAESFIIKGNEWYVCDIIGERVFGFALLNYPGKTITWLKKLAVHKSNWMVRCIGVASHYAIKKGLDPSSAQKMFKLLLSLSGSKDFHTKKGIGWAAKTTAKFHPQIIHTFKKEIYENEDVMQWFKTKIKIGLSRSFKYAAKYNR